MIDSKTENDFFKTQRLTNPELENIIDKEFKLLDHGFVRVIDYMGGDNSIVQAARVSYGKGTKKSSQDKGLIRYLMRHRHTTPFEMCEIKFHIKLPIFVARQWIRHRMANVNEYSARYSILDKEFYVPTQVSEQSKINHQGRGDVLDGQEAFDNLNIIRDFSLDAYDKYINLMNIDEIGNVIDEKRKGLARELARMVLPTNYYTQWYWKIDLHNLLHFISLRADPHAQEEIRVYAEKLAEIVKLWVPYAYEAFEDYRMNSIHLSSLEKALLKQLMKGEKIEKRLVRLSEREWGEFLIKFDLKESDIVNASID
jgi:thymidylate synthase (FAD)